VCSEFKTRISVNKLPSCRADVHTAAGYVTSDVIYEHTAVTSEMNVLSL